MSNYKVYLAGPITGKTYGSATDWRESASSWLSQYGIETLSPMRGKDFILSRVAQVEVLAQTYDAPMSKQKGIVARDRHDVMACNAVLFNLLPYAIDEVTGQALASIGTCVEFGWCDAFRKLAIVVLDEADKKNPHTHAFLKEIAGFIVPTLDEALEIVRIVAKTSIKQEALGPASSLYGVR